MLIVFLNYRKSCLLSEDTLTSNTATSETSSVSANTESAAIPTLQERSESEVEASDENDSIIDDEIIEIFIEEAEEVVESINQHYPAFKAAPDDQSALSELRRAYHTLKGSGRMVQAAVIAELAWSIENMLNRLIENSIESSHAMFVLLEQVNGLIPILVHEFEQSKASDLAAVALLQQQAEALSTGKAIVETVPTLQQAVPTAQQQIEAEVDQAAINNTLSANEADREQLSQTIESDTTSLLVSDQMLGIDDAAKAEKIASDDPEYVEFTEDDASVVDDLFTTELPSENEFDLVEADETLTPEQIQQQQQQKLLLIFSEELAQHYQTIEQFIAAGAHQVLSDDLLRAMHTIKGSAHMAGIDNLAALVAPLENLIKEYIELNIALDDASFAIIEQAGQIIGTAFADLQAHKQVQPQTEQLVAAIAQLRQQTIASLHEQQAELEETGNPILRFLTQNMDLIIDSDHLVSLWPSDGLQLQESDHADELQQLLGYCQQLHQQAADIELLAFEQISEVLGQYYQSVSLHFPNLTADEVALLKQAHETLILYMDCLAAGQSIKEDQQLLNLLKALLPQHIADLSDESGIG